MRYPDWPVLKELPKPCTHPSLALFLTSVSFKTAFFFKCHDCQIKVLEMSRFDLDGFRSNDELEAYLSLELKKVSSYVGNVTVRSRPSEYGTESRNSDQNHTLYKMR